ncbi:hypothetical protein EYF80_031911 [Liparis tanakae]|uniref:Uncharacterized protein n=1 Tax=Liparis tanakae TaxID=230148 RepID=A0A4Z2GWK1_9TELE|nr:hypothetical protein EYF80_031911 [Liparis tanakae]
MSAYISAFGSGMRSFTGGRYCRYMGSTVDRYRVEFRAAKTLLFMVGPAFFQQSETSFLLSSSFYLLEMDSGMRGRVGARARLFETPAKEKTKEKEVKRTRDKGEARHGGRAVVWGPLDIVNHVVLKQVGRAPLVGSSGTAVAAVAQIGALGCS